MQKWQKFFINVQFLVPYIWLICNNWVSLFNLHIHILSSINVRFLCWHSIFQDVPGYQGVIKEIRPPSRGIQIIKVQVELDVQEIEADQSEVAMKSAPDHYLKISTSELYSI